MNNSKLSSLLSKLEALASEASEYSAESLNDDLASNLKGGVRTTNGSCGGTNNSSCSNNSCAGSTNGSCGNSIC